MNTQRASTLLALLNVGILVFLLTQIRPVEANGTALVLRGRALEIVDAKGKVRASIQIVPAGPAPGLMVRYRRPTGRYTLKRCSFA